VENHKPWQNPPLQEAIFEIRFPPLSDYALFAGGMAVGQKERFPNTQRLQSIEIPDIIEIAGLVKHRFVSVDQSLLFQTGPDVLSVNAVQYQGFLVFLKDIREILEASEKFIRLPELTRLGLRYINCFPNVISPSSVLNINMPFQNADASKTRFLQLNEVLDHDNGALLSITVQFPIDSQSLILDLNVNLDVDSTHWDIASILDWTKQAHGAIWDNFEQLVSQSEKEVRQ
jgi:uncharacterized protein (TIGR04255 family)